MFYEEYAGLPFTKGLEDNWKKIHDEITSFADDHFKVYEHSQDSGWEILMLAAFGTTNEALNASCPTTMRIINNMPNVTMALVSKLKAGSEIHLHTDKGVWLESEKRYVTYDNPHIIRCHLGLSVPANSTIKSCAFKVNEKIKQWKQGKTFFFSFSEPHQAWNHTNEDRIVLIVDFMKEAETLEITDDIKVFRQYLVNTYM